MLREFHHYLSATKGRQNCRYTIRINQIRTNNNTCTVSGLTDYAVLNTSIGWAARSQYYALELTSSYYTIH